MKKKITAAAVQMCAKLGDVEANLEKTSRLIDEAFHRGAELVVVPEFFTSAMGFHSSLLQSALSFNGKALQLLLNKAREHRGAVGGSFLAQKEDGHRYNTFIMAFPDGKYYTHDKDLPTMWENCYYRGGDDPGIMGTPWGPIGVALCWEMIRTQTVKRLRSQIDLLVAGSCWWTLPDRSIPFPFKKRLSQINLKIMQDTPARMARLLGVPVVHAANAGDFTCAVPWLPGFKYRSFFLGETQIVDEKGNILSRMAREDGEGVIVAEINTGKNNPAEQPPDSFWIPRLPFSLKLFWHYQNLHGKRYYRKNIRAQ